MSRELGGRGLIRLSLAAACVSLACTGGGVGRIDVTVTDSAGVKIVMSSGPDRPLGVRAVHLGDLETPDDALTTVPWAIAADPLAGRVYVADRLARVVHIFDDSGAYVRSFGVEGDGPGEFRNPSAIALDQYGAVTVWDTGRGILSTWSSEGALLNERRPPLPYWGPGFALEANELTTVITSSESTDMRMVQQLVSQSSQGRQVLFELTAEQTLMELPCATMPAPKIFSPSIVWSRHADAVLVLNGPGYRVDAYSGGVATRSVRRDISPLTVTDAMAVASVESGAGPYRTFMRRCGVTASDLALEVGHEERVSPVLGVAVDPDGRLWVTRSLDGIRPNLVDVLNPAGDYEGSFATSGMPVAFLSSGVFISLGVDEAGLLTVSLHRLEEAGGLDSRPGDAVASADRERLADNEFRDCPHCPVMVMLAPGDFLLGSPPGEEPAAQNPDRPEWTERAEKPQVAVSIEYSFAIGKYEVTFAEWDSCVEAGGCSHEPDDNGWGRGSRPVMNISRDHAEEYAAWLSGITGETYRLPSESEWEYAARAGTTTARYWGDQLGHGMAACDGCGSEWDEKSTAPVGSFAANPFGIHDMLGNVAEWVADCWIDSHIGQPADGRARTTESPWWRGDHCERPVQRGGAWTFFGWTTRSAKRLYYHPGPWLEYSNTVGFRVVRSDPAPSTQ